MTRACALASVVLSTATLVTYASLQDPAEDNVQIEEREGFRHITSNGLPDHPIGTFVESERGRERVQTPRSQEYRFRVTMKPEEARRPTPVTRGPFGVALNGVVFDPRIEETYSRRDNNGWSYEPSRNREMLQLDANNAHLGDREAYHYHGLPTGFLTPLGRPTDMRLIGWAADGFPIYDQYGYRDPNDPESGLKVLNPSYWVKPGNRASGPGGPHDGTFVEDWHYVAGRGDLDECNGRRGVTPEFPDGTYYYVVTERFPGVPRLFRGTPDPSFTQRGRGREW
jgi:hypothetical protein